jgi:hypothetical protein
MAYSINPHYLRKGLAMATQNITLKKTDGWKEISSTNKVYAACANNSTLRAAWSTAAPANNFIGYPVPAGLGIARDFELGKLYLLLPHDSHLDEVVVVFDEA